MQGKMQGQAMELRNNFPTLGTQLSEGEVERLGDECVSSFSEYLGISLHPFKKHLVDDGSFAAHCHGEHTLRDRKVCSIEAIVLLGLRPEGAPPAICAELLHFIRGRRVGFQDCGGASYLCFIYDLVRGWLENGYELDSDEEWATITSPRYSEYSDTQTTYDGWGK
jgi:hypothetical protein